MRPYHHLCISKHDMTPFFVRYFMYAPLEGHMDIVYSRLLLPLAWVQSHFLLEESWNLTEASIGCPDGTKSRGRMYVYSVYIYIYIHMYIFSVYIDIDYIVVSMTYVWYFIQACLMYRYKGISVPQIYGYKILVSRQQCITSRLLLGNCISGTSIPYHFPSLAKPLPVNPTVEQMFVVKRTR